MLVKENIVYLFHAKLVVLEISIGFFELNWLLIGRDPQNIRVHIPKVWN